MGKGKEAEIVVVVGRVAVRLIGWAEMSATQRPRWMGREETEGIS